MESAHDSKVAGHFRKHKTLDITSDRDIRFTSHFWAAVMKKLDVKLNMSTAFHP